jgi:hypothetical protein
VILLAIMLTQLKAISESPGPIVGFIGGILGIIALPVTAYEPVRTSIDNKKYRKHPFIMTFTEHPHIRE